MTVTGAQLSLRPKGAKGDTGVGSAGPAGAGADGLWQPRDAGCLAWSIDPLITPGVASVWGVNFLQLVSGKMDVTSAITKIGLALRGPAPAGLANTLLGIYTISGSTATLIGSTPDISSTMNGVATPTLFDLTVPTPSLAAGTKFFFGLYYSAASTGPAVSGLSSRPNAFISSLANYRTLAKSTPGLTALPATVDLTTCTDPGVVLCVVAQ